MEHQFKVGAKNALSPYRRSQHHTVLIPLLESLDCECRDVSPILKCVYDVV